MLFWRKFCIITVSNSNSKMKYTKKKKIKSVSLYVFEKGSYVKSSKSEVTVPTTTMTTSGMTIG